MELQTKVQLAPAGSADLAPADLRQFESVTMRDRLFDALPDLVFEFDENGTFVCVNNRVEEVTGFSQAELLQKLLWDLLTPQSRRVTRNRWQQAPETEIELAITSRTGNVVTLEVRCSRYALADGRRVYLGIGRDITERTRAEQFEKERRRLLEMLIAGADFSSCLTLIGDLIQKNLRDGKCVIIPPAQEALQAREDLRGLASREADCKIFEQFWAEPDAPFASPGLQAVNRQTGILLKRLRPDFADGVGRPGPFLYYWALPVGKGSAQGGQIIVLRENSRAPDRLESALLEGGRDLLRYAIEHGRLTTHLRHSARHDALTGLPNQAMFREQVSAAIARAGAEDRGLAIVLIGLNDFHLFNDSAGRDFGDSLLRLAARRIREWTSPSGVVARIGENEFALLIEPASGEAEVEQAVMHLVRAFEHPFRADGAEFFIGASAGGSIYPHNGRTAEQLLRAADAALHYSKAHSRGSWKIHNAEMDAELKNRLLIQTQLHRAVDRAEFSLVYQPQLSLEDGTLKGVEALLRWNNTVLGRVSPGDFIPVAEYSGLIIEIGKWVLRDACRQAREWRDLLGTDAPRVAVNVSALQFRQPNFVDLVAEAMSKAGIAPEQLELELTESVVMTDFVQAQLTLERLREMRVRIALDDFGTGYSSLGYLERLPVNALKLDASFIRRIIPEDPEPPLLKGIIGLAHSLDVEVIAEGVETEVQFSSLRKVGCDQVQGYLISKPVSPESIPKMYSVTARLERLKLFDGAPAGGAKTLKVAV